MTIQARSVRTGLIVLAIVLALAGLLIVAQLELHPHILSSLLGGTTPRLAGICDGIPLPC